MTPASEVTEQPSDINKAIECVHCHAVKNKIKNHDVGKVKKLTYCTQ